MLSESESSFVRDGSSCIPSLHVPDSSSSELSSNSSSELLSIVDPLPLPLPLPRPRVPLPQPRVPLPLGASDSVVPCPRLRPRPLPPRVLDPRPPCPRPR
ncbi:unnamed protein product, partial [Mycena citricolor]